MSANDVKNALMPMLLDSIATMNAHVDRINAGTINVGKLVHDIRNDETVTDAKVKEYQEWYEAANASILATQAKIDAYIKDNLLPKPDESIDVAAEREAYKAAKRAVDSNLDVFGLHKIELAEGELPERKSPKGSGSGAATGDGPKRPRFAMVLVNGAEAVDEKTDAKTGVVKRTTNLTIAARKISSASGTKVEPGDLAAAIFAEANTTDLKTVPDREFTVSITAGDKNYTLTVRTPDPDAKPADDAKATNGGQPVAVVPGSSEAPVSDDDDADLDVDLDDENADDE